MIEATLARYRAEYGDDIPAACHPDIRSREACIKSTKLALELARTHGTRLHVLHISTADELALFTPGPLIDENGVRKRIPDRKSTRLNSKSLMRISYACFCLKTKTKTRSAKSS